MDGGGQQRQRNISSDHLVITETSLDVDAAARLGTLVIGFVPVRP